MGGSESVNDLAELIGRLLGKEVERVHGPDRPGDVRLSCADISAARDAIGYEPVVGFEEGLQRTIDTMLDPEGRHEVTYAFGAVDELGEGYGFRKVRQALGVEAFGVNVIVMPPGYEGFFHYHEEQDELYFVHAGTARVEVEGEDRLLGPGGMIHVSSTTPRRVSNGGADDLVVLVVGGKGGYVGRDGRLVDEADAGRRASFGHGEVAG